MMSPLALPDYLKGNREITPEWLKTFSARSRFSRRPYCQQGDCAGAQTRASERLLLITRG
jgi:hypothetical protein